MRTRRHKLQVSTFPFLAVLLCAMGALLLVLLVMDRRAHYAARARAEQAARHLADDTAAAAEAQRSAVEQRRQEAQAARQRERDAAHGRLVGQEAEVQKEIQSVRDELARAAERVRAEQDDEAALKQQINAEHTQAGEEEQAIIRVRAEQATAAAQSEASRKAREEMTATLARLEQKLADLRAARDKEKVTYSLVPYNGKHGDSRRPIYVECAAGRVVFYPDWTPLEEPLDAAALQAEVERRVARQKEKLPGAQAAAFTPYLLLLVRPDGISTYYRLREALQGFKIDFGYEFVDRDWVLDFPADDQDAPPPAWTTAAKPSAGDAPPPPPPGGAASRLHGVPPGGEEGSPVASGLAEPPPALSGPPLFPRNTNGASTAAGGAPFGGPAGNGKGGSAVALNDAPLPGPPDANSGPVLSGPGGPSRPAAPGGGTSQGGGPGGSPGSAAPTDPRMITSGPPGAPTGSVPPPPGPGQAPTPSGPGQAPTPNGTGQAPAQIGTGQGTGNAAPATATAGRPPSAFASARPPQGGAPAPGSTGPGPVAATDKSAAPTVPGPNQGTSQAPPSTDAAKNPPTSPTAPPGGAGPRPAGGDRTAAADNPEDDPFLKTPPSPLPPSVKHQPATLRPARLSGDRDWIIYVECKPEGVVIYPTQLLVPAAALNRPSGSNPLLRTIQQMIDRKQAFVRHGEMPYRPEVRFLVRPEAERTYHLAYPTLDALAAPKTSQNLGPDDDVSAVVAGH